MAEVLIEDAANPSLQYLASKRSEIASPGIKMMTEYYSALNSSVQLAEVNYNIGRFTVSLNNLSFNGFTQVLIPNQSLVSTVYLSLTLPPILSNQTICKGWGLAIINSISFILGASNVSQITIPGYSMFSALMAESDSNEKMDDLLVNAGSEQLVPTAGNINANIMIRLPFSGACALKSKLPYDSSMLNNPIILQINFGSAATIYGGSNTTIPTGFLQAQLVLCQGDFTNKENSLSFPLRANPTLEYTYPWIHLQQASVGQFFGSTNSSQPVSVTLQSIINSDLVAIYFYAVQTQYLSSSAGSSPSPFLADQLSNIQLLFNGLVLYQTPNTLSNLVDDKNTPGAFYYTTSLLTSLGGGGFGPYSDTPVKCYLSEISFSRLRAICIGNEMMNTLRIGNQSLVLNFNTSTTNSYQLFVTYCYNSVIETSQGNSKIYFD
jgi:hypothetical protein